MTDYRAMCVELLAWAERTSSHYYKQADVIVRARALLAESDGREPTSVPMQPSDDAIASPLSPAAKAVAWAYDNAPEKTTGNHRYHWIAAALRAAVAHTQQHHGHDVYSREVWECDADELLAIADELEGL